MNTAQPRYGRSSRSSSRDGGGAEIEVFLCGLVVYGNVCVEMGGECPRQIVVVLEDGGGEGSEPDPLIGSVGDIAFCSYDTVPIRRSRRAVYVGARTDGTAEDVLCGRDR